MEAFKKHFDQLKKKYGAIASVNLTELNGREAIVGGAYKENICKLNDINIEYVYNSLLLHHDGFNLYICMCF